jgi:hypothetical protein
MTTTARLLSAAAAVALAVIVGVLALPRPGGGPAAQPTTGPSASPIAPSAAPSASPTFPQALEGPMAPGSYTTTPFFTPIPSLPLTFTVPAGYTFVPDWAIIPTSTGSEGPQGAGLSFLQPNGLFSDPCHWDIDKDGILEAGDIPTGSNVDDLVTALQSQSAYDVTVVGDVTLGGYSGKRVDLRFPATLDLTKCDKLAGFPSAWLVWGPIQGDAPDLYIQGPGNRWQVDILDVAGNRVVVVYQDFATTPAAARTDMLAIHDSLQFEP